jgi:hypothetical protein
VEEGESKELAAAAYDAGVGFFEKAEYLDAAKAFLRADELLPNDDALANAIVAAGRANALLLVAEAAQRAITRQGVDPEVAAKARDALADASRRLSLVKLSCAEDPCTLKLDGELVSEGDHYLLPGNHAFGAESGSAQKNESLLLEAGATYTLRLQPQEEAKPSLNRSPEADVSRTTVPPVVFYVGVGLTVALAGVTVWSGLDTLSAKDELPPNPTQDDLDPVEGKVLRTDLLLAGSVVAGAATAFVGLQLVDWSSGDSGGVGLVAPTMVSYSGRF